MCTICLIAISKDFFDSVLPKPELSGDEADFPERLPRGEFLSSILGVPLEDRPLEGEHDCRLGLPLDEGSTDEDRDEGAPGLPLDADSGLSGRVVLKLGGASSENPGISDGFHGLDLSDGELPRDGTGCLEVTGVGCLEVTGAGCLEVTGVGCLEVTGAGCLEVTVAGCLEVTVADCLEITVAGNLDTTGAGCLDVIGATCLDVIGDGCLDEEVLTEGAETLGSLDGVDDRRVGVDALDTDLEGGKVGLLVGVEDLAVDLDKGVEDLDGIVGLAAGTVVLMAEVEVLLAETMGLAAEIVLLDVATMFLVEGKVPRVGVEDLDDFEVAVDVSWPVGVPGRDPGPPDDKGLLVVPQEELITGIIAGCLDTMLVLPLPVGSD
ncbi:hypothetical protein Lal_00001444 [Lupinus albus]|nr:hypothetical protein Lal_00001444 [Lupinus albus]